MRIDAHHHLWDLSVRDQDWTRELPGLHRTFTLSELRPLLAAHDIEATVLVQTVALVEETVDFLALAAGEGDDVVAGVVGWVDLTAPDVRETVARLRGLPGGNRLVGLRHLVQSEPDRSWLCRDDVRRGLAAVAEAGLVYDLLVRPGQLPAAIQTVAELPELTFVLDHCAKPDIAHGEVEPWQQHLRELSTHDNVSVKLSGLVTEAGADWTVGMLRPYAETVLDAFGPDRTMFGSDWPVSLLAASYATWFETAEGLLESFSQADRDAVFGGTARRVYGLRRPSLGA